MREGRPSRTAVWVAAWRGLGAFDDPVVAVDPVAVALVPPVYRAILRAAERSPRATRAVWRGAVALSGGVARHLPFRTRAIDDALAAELARGTRQVVLLGAGLDGRAHRLKTLGDARVFEVDFPATQATKRAAARSLPVLAREVIYVAVDFARDDLVSALASAGHDAAAPTVFVWEGVMMYLDDAAIETTLGAVERLAAPGSLLLATYYTDAPMRHAALALPVFALAGEPLRTRTSHDELAARLAAHGLELERDEGDSEWAARYVGARISAWMSERLVAARAVTSRTRT